MKRYILLFIVSFILAFTACESDYLDKMEEAEGLSFEDVFMDSINYKSFCDQLITLPTMRRFADQTKPLGDFDDVSDNSVSGPEWSGVPGLQASQGDFYALRGNTNATMCNGETWSKIWSQVRIANISIENIDYYPGSETTRRKLLGQSYFFRGFAYFELTRRWGGMPYLYKSLAADDEMDLPRLGYQETLIRAAADLDTAATYLRLTIPDNEWGLPTRVAALAFKAKVLVYASSEFAMQDAGAENLWEEAALAANEAIQAAEEAGLYMVPMADYAYIFQEQMEEIYTKEVIYGRYYQNTWGGNNYKQRFRPPGQLEGQYATSPNQLLVDCFEMQGTGLPISDPQSGYDPQNPYAGRDPRLEESIVHNQQKVMTKTMQIFDRDETKNPPVIGSVDLQYSGGTVSMGYTKTGYYNNKWLGRQFRKHARITWPEIRMSELYLLFAEAANEAWNAPDVKTPGTLYSAEEALNKVRNRAEMPNIASKFLNKNDFRERVRNERRVELCFEDNRLFDIRRWKIAHLPENRDIWKMEITKVKKSAEYPAGFRYEPRLLQTRVFEDKHYLFVIDLDDTRIGPNFQQNPGW